MPERPSTSPRHTASRSAPSAERHPIPVTTTRRLLAPDPLTREIQRMPAGLGRKHRGGTPTRVASDAFSRNATTAGTN